MQSSTTTLTTTDGHELFIYSWLPDAPPVAAIYIAHGMAEHAARYARLARELTAAGFAVHANDHRGHGRTSPREEDRGFFAEKDGWARVVADIAEMIGWVRQQHPGLKVAFFGHSMGSQLGQDYLQRYNPTVDAAVFSGTTGKPPAIAALGRIIARAERLRLGKRGRSAIIDQMTFKDFNKKFGKTRTDFDWLSRDTAEVDAYIADPDCGFICSVQLWVELLDNLRLFTRDANQAKTPSDLPLYLFAGDRDPVGEMGRSVDALAEDYRRAGLTDVTLQLYPGARHETLNEINRDVVTRDLLSWLKARL